MFVLITLFAPESSLCSGPCTWRSTLTNCISKLACLLAPSGGLGSKCGSGPSQPEATAGDQRVKRKHTQGISFLFLPCLSVFSLVTAASSGTSAPQHHSPPTAPTGLQDHLSLPPPLQLQGITVSCYVMSPGASRFFVSLTLSTFL